MQCNTYKESIGRFLARKRPRSLEAASLEKEQVRSGKSYSIARARHFAFSQGSNTTGIKLETDEDDKGGDGKDGVQVFNFAKVVRLSTATKKDSTSLFFWCANGRSKMVEYNTSR